MSKQENEVGRLLRMLYPELREQVELSKIIGSGLYAGIRVDFYIPSIRCVVEVHGVQHHKPSGFGRSKVDTTTQFNRQLDRDAKLVAVCKKFEVNYEQIDYTETVDFASIVRRFSKYQEEECTSE